MNAEEKFHEAFTMPEGIPRKIDAEAILLAKSAHDWIIQQVKVIFSDHCEMFNVNSYGGVLKWSLENGILEVVFSTDDGNSRGMSVKFPETYFYMDQDERRRSMGLDAVGKAIEDAKCAAENVRQRAEILASVDVERMNGLFAVINDGPLAKLSGITIGWR